MEKFLITGGNKLYGSVKVHSAKNSILPLLAGAILTKEKVVIYDCPNITDIVNMLDILRILGVDIVREGSTVTVSGGIKSTEIPTELAKAIRSSIFLLGSILATMKKARVAYPGGCDIGIRPIDIHLKGLRALNIDIEEHGGYINCVAKKIVGADIQLDKISVGATENIIMASVLAEGKTTIRNAAKEPEIVDLVEMLNKMGAKIKGAGSSIIEIVGVDSLHGTEHKPIPDRIVAGTLITAVALTGGEIELQNVIPEHLTALTAKLTKSACNIRQYYDKIVISSNGKRKSEDYETLPYPAFPTDMQAQVMVLSTVSKGTSLIVENIFETRFKHVPELKRMGANIVVHGNISVVRGVSSLYGAEVFSSDLRGGAALVLAGLCAKGQTIVNDIYHIDRGYESLENTLSCLGADIKRVGYE